MTTKTSRRSTRVVDFSGEFERSQLVVGDHNTVHRYEGTVVQVLPPGATPTPRPAPRPQMRLPRAGELPLGRDGELGVARRALADAAPAEFHGAPGIGKTALLRHLAHDPGASWPDGIVHVRVAGQPLEDVLQWLFDVFWTTEPPWAPGPLRVREYLRELRALVVFDDVEFTRDECTELLDAATQSTFLLAATEPHLEATERTVALRGLPATAAVAAFERCLGRPLDDGESGRAAELVGRLGGVPALVLEAARIIRDGVCRLSDLAHRPDEELARRRVLALTDAQRRLLALLAELAPAAVPAELLSADATSGARDLAALERADLVETSSPRYALARPLPSAAREGLPAVEPAAFLELVGASQEGALVEDAAPAAVAALDWGRRVGALDAVVDAARALDGALLGTRRTGAWGSTIAHGVAAARDLGRAADEAYFLHQQGTRWLCLDEPGLAEDHLRRALELRERVGDEAGAAASRHNLDVLGGRPGGWPGGGGPSWFPARAWPWALGALAAVAGLGLGAALGSAGGNNGTSTVTVPGQTVTVPPKTVTKAVTKTVTLSPKTITVPGKTVTVTETVTTTVTTTVNPPR
jgi:hypothetical protein